MRYLILLLFPTLLFAQTDLAGDDWRFATVNTTSFATPAGSPNIEIPKCLVDEVISQCILMFDGFPFNRSLFDGGTTADRLFIPRFRLVVEPVNPKYESGGVIVDVDGTILMDVMYIDTDVGIVAVCDVAFLLQAETYRPVAWMPCGDDIMVPTEPTVDAAPTPFDPIVNNAATNDIPPGDSN